MYRPKVGEECFVATTDHDFMKCKIVAYDDLDVIYRPENRSLYSDETNRCQFRPIKSKQDTEIEEIESILNSGGGWVEPALRLYNAGYRKQISYDEFVSKIDVFLYDLERIEYHPQIAFELAHALNRTSEGN